MQNRPKQTPRRRSWIWVLCLALLGSIFTTGISDTAAAEVDTGGYPDWNTECVYYPYNTTGACQGYNWGIVRDSTADNSIYSSRGYGYRNCTDFAAWWLQNNGVADSATRGRGHAKTWANRTTDATVTSEPEVGDVAVFTGGDYGHVAIVGEVRLNSSGVMEVRLLEYNWLVQGGYSNSRWVSVTDVSNFVDFNGVGIPLGGSGGSTSGDASKVTELGFVRSNHSSGRTQLVSWQGAPHYSTLKLDALTGYPAISDPANVRYIAIKTNDDKWDEFAAVRTNHSSGKTEISLWHGSPSYTTHLGTYLTGYPAISDPQNVAVVPIDVNRDNVDELAFIRLNHSSGKAEMVLYKGAPRYDVYVGTYFVNFNAVSDPQNISVMAMDLGGDATDELVFIRKTHSSGKMQLTALDGAPNFLTVLHNGATGYPSVADPQNVTPVALDLTGDGVDELGFVRTNHSSGRAELVLYHGAPHFSTFKDYTLTGYPATNDPARVKVIALDLG